MTLKAIDLYSGIGGWTTGLKMNGIQVLKSYEYWSDANQTHNQNFGTQNEEINIRSLVDDSGIIRKELLPKPNEIDFVVGSPPCTQFSFSNRGGSGDIQDGLKDVYAFLQIVSYLRPKKWAMENVPRVAQILSQEVFSDSGTLRKFSNLFNDDPSCIAVYDSADFGVAQNRKRMIAGNFNHSLLNSYKKNIERKTLGDILESLNRRIVVDPYYNIEIRNEELFDNVKETFLNQQELRLNQESKSYHPVYNKMSFPDSLNRPSRTVTSLCTRISRESIIIRDTNNFRRLTVRERASLQSFPINFNFYGKSHISNLKQVGNAIPPLLVYYLINSFNQIKTPQNPKEIDFSFICENQEVNEQRPVPPKYRFNEKRRFRAALKGLRFGSGVRFELNNSFIEGHPIWTIDFFYGSSKDIKNIKLSDETYKIVKQLFDELKIDLTQLIDRINIETKAISFKDLQKSWASKDTDFGPFELVDLFHDIYKPLINRVCTQSEQESFKDLIHVLLDNNSKKIEDNSYLIAVGVLVGSLFNRSYS